MIIFVKDEDDALVIPVGLGPNVGEQICPEPVLDDITLDSSTMEQTVTPEIGVDGFSSVTVNPYVLDSKTVDSSTVGQTIVSDEDGLSSVTVNPVTAAIDSNIIPENIKKNVSILGVTGTYDVTGMNWIIEARKNNITDLSGYSLNGLTAYTSGARYLFYVTDVTSAPVFDSSVIGYMACTDMFRGSGITSFENDEIERIEQLGCYQMFYNAPLTYLSLPNLTTVDASTYANKGIAWMLDHITGTNVTVNLPKLSNIPQLFLESRYSGNQGYIKGSLYNIKATSYSNSTVDDTITSINVHANAFSLFFPCIALVNVNITDGLIDYDISCYSDNLTRDSVYSIISHLDTGVSGKRLYFGKVASSVTPYTYTFTDWEDGRFQAAYDAAIAAGWTISTVVINPYS